MKKKALSLALALAMCVGLATTLVYAGGVSEAEICIRQKDSTTGFNPRTQTTALSGVGWNYAPSTKTLTLDNFSGEYLGIYRSGDITLKLSGNNNLLDVRFLGAGDSTEGNRVTIIGDGSLTTKFMITSIPVVQTSATITVTGEEGNYGKEYGIFINNGDNTSFHMTGGTLNATGREYGIWADGPQGQILLEGGTVTAQGGLAAIWCEYDTPPERSTDIFSVAGRKIVGGETAENVRAMTIKTAEISHDSGGLIPSITTYHFTSVSDKELTVGEFTYEHDEYAKNSGAAKYVYIADTQPEQPAQSPSAKDFTYTPPQSLTYDGSSKTAAVRAAVTSSVHNGYFTLAFVDGQGNPVTDLVKPGTYRVLARVSAHGGYAAGEVSLGSLTITESPGLHGRISISVGDDASQSSGGTAYVASDVIITVHASPDPGYQLSIIRVTRDDNGQQIPLSGSGNTRTFRMPPADVSIQAEFSVR